MTFVLGTNESIIRRHMVQKYRPKDFELISHYHPSRTVHLRTGIAKGNKERFIELSTVKNGFLEAR